MPYEFKNINSTFFNGFYKDVWRQMNPPGLTEAENLFIEDVAQLQKGHHVLDIMCGYGRHIIDLARKGYATTGIDNAQEYIEEIENIKQQEALNITAIHADISTLELPAVYDAAICMGNSFAFFNKEEALHVLQSVSAHLRQGGVFILNTWMIAEIAIRQFKEKDWFYVGDYKYLVDQQYLFHPSRIQSEHTIIRADGETEVLQGVDYILSITEMEELFRQAGLSTTGLYATPRKKKFRLGDPNLYMVGQKL